MNHWSQDEPSVEFMNIIGCGRAASSLAGLWAEAGRPKVRGVMNRSLSSSRKAVDALGFGNAIEGIEHFRPAHYWLIGASDAQIEPVAERLSQSPVDLEGSVVFHLCGRHGLEILSSLESRGCHLVAVHPVRSLTHKRITIEDFEGTACVAEGRPAALESLQPLFDRIGAHWMPVSGLDRGLYHASVSIISNITKAVTWKAQNWMVRAGLDADSSGEISQKLLSSTLEDISRSGAKQSITGPVVRGDTRTVEAHIEAIADSYPNDLDVYRVLARTVLELAVDRGDLDEKTLQQFRHLLIRGA